VPIGHVVVSIHVKGETGIVDAGVVTAATLAPCLAAFLREFFVYQALENSVIPKRISNNKKSTNAVSINV
jgi:hypothetical protein